MKNQDTDKIIITKTRLRLSEPTVSPLNHNLKHPNISKDVSQSEKTYITSQEETILWDTPKPPVRKKRNKT